MNSRKALSLVSLILLAGTILVPSSMLAQSQSYDPNPSVQDVGTKLRSDSLADVKAANRLELSGSEAGTAPGSAGPKALAQSDVGVVKKWLTSNDYTSKYGLTDFTLKAVGT